MLNLADFALQEQLEGNLMVAISRAWYNGSYTMAAKPIKSLELHYTMIQFLIIWCYRNVIRLFLALIFILNCISKTPLSKQFVRHLISLPLSFNTKDHDRTQVRRAILHKMQAGP